MTETQVTDVLSYDITRAAQSYSQIAGILAGFAFVILVWLVERLLTAEHKHEPRIINELTQQALMFLGVTFVANLVVCVLWALVSGETQPQANRPRALGLFATLNFALVSPLTLEAVVFVVATTNHEAIVSVFRRICFVSIAIAVFYVWITVIDLFAIAGQAEPLPVLNARWQFFSWLSGVTVTPIVLGWFLNRWIINRPAFTRKMKIFKGFVYSWMIWIFGTTVGFGVVGMRDVNEGLPSAIILFVCFVWAALMGWGLTFLPRHHTATAVQFQHVTRAHINSRAELTSSTSTDDRQLTTNAIPTSERRNTIKDNTRNMNRRSKQTTSRKIRTKKVK